MQEFKLIIGISIVMGIHFGLIVPVIEKLNTSATWHILLRFSSVILLARIVKPLLQL